MTRDAQRAPTIGVGLPSSSASPFSLSSCPWPSPLAYPTSAPQHTHSPKWKRVRRAYFLCSLLSSQGSCAREDVVRGEGREKARVAVTQPFRDPKSQSEASPSLLSQMQPSNGQQVCSAERCCSLTFYQLSYFDTPGCPLTPAFPRVLGK